MFTGIINGKGKLISISGNYKFRTFVVKFPKKLLKNLKVGYSVSNNGCCLSVISIDKDEVSFDLVEETLKSTNLINLKFGDLINLERAIKYGEEIGGHLMSGHIIGKAKLIKLIKKENKCKMWFSIKNLDIMQYIFNKGFIGLDGISLTISKIVKNTFCVNIIPETIRCTTIGEKNIGDLLNIEIDPYIQIIVQNIKKILNKKFN